MVGLGDDAHVEFDHDDGVVGVDEPLRVSEQSVAVGRVEPSSGLVEDVERVAALSTLEFGCQLDTLSFRRRTARWRVVRVAGNPTRPRVGR